MRRIRVIPVLLLHQGGLVKTIKFKDPTYIGDPINAVKIFNEKEIDEIVILDIDASREQRGPDFALISQLASEAFIPLAYGGGISTLEEINKLFYLGVEKVIFNFQAFYNPKLLTEASKIVGRQSVVGSIDVKKNWLGKYFVYVNRGTLNTKLSPVDFSRQLEDAGVGEIFLNLIDRDGTYQGYDTEIIEKVCSSVSIPVVACGGASDINDFSKAVHSGASAVAAGSIFVFQRAHRAVLINYPSQSVLKERLYSRI